MATKVTFLLRELQPQPYPPGGSYAPGEAQHVECWGFMQPITAARFASVVGQVSDAGWQFVGHIPCAIPSGTEVQWDWHDGNAHKGAVAGNPIWKGRAAPATVTIGEVP